MRRSQPLGPSGAGDRQLQVGPTPSAGAHGEEGRGMPPLPSHDAEAWRAEFGMVLQDGQGYIGSRLRGLRRDIQQGTLRAIQLGGYTAQDDYGAPFHVALPIDEMDAGILGTHVYREGGRWVDPDPPPPADGPFGRTVVRVRERDCLLAAHDMCLAAPGSHVAVLNMANASTPGGGWLHGSGAQEENLHRRTTLCEHLHGASCRRGSVPGPQPEVRYPLPEFGGVYSPAVFVLRGCEDAGYPYLVQPWPVTVITCAAYHSPSCTRRRNGQQALVPSLEDGTRRKIRSMLAAAKRNGVRRFVLCAFGCGAYRNPPEHIAEIFVQCLAEPGTKGYFEEVTFAILDDHNSPEGGNLRPFRAAVRDAYLRWLPPRVAPRIADEPGEVGEGKGGYQRSPLYQLYQLQRMRQAAGSGRACSGAGQGEESHKRRRWSG